MLACKKKERSTTTGWAYNDPKWGGFEKLPYQGQATGPNLVLVEGGTFKMGLTEQDVTFEWNNVPRRVTVSSFYMDETEVTNTDYREYLYWLDRVFSGSAHLGQHRINVLTLVGEAGFEQRGWFCDFQGIRFARFVSLPKIWA